MDRTYIKNQAKQLIGGKTFSLFGVAFLATIFTFLNFNIIYDIGDIFNMARYGGDFGFTTGFFAVSSSFFSLFISIAAIPFAVGMEAFFLKFIRTGESEFVGGVKFAYKTSFEDFGNFLWTAFSTQVIIFLWSLLFIIPGIFAKLRYFFVNKIISDNPTLTPKQARSISERMTTGYIGDLFVLELSFFGWYILTALSFGLASIYVLPYYQTTTSLFYENCKNRAFISGVVNPSELINPLFASNVPPQQGNSFDFNQQNQGYQPMGNQYQAPIQHSDPTAPYDAPIEHTNPVETPYEAPAQNNDVDPVDFYNNSLNKSTKLNGEEIDIKDKKSDNEF